MSEDREVERSECKTLRAPLGLEGRLTLQEFLREKQQTFPTKLMEQDSSFSYSLVVVVVVLKAVLRLQEILLH